MPHVTLSFEVHQPFRLRDDFFWNRRMFKKADKDFEGLFEYYFSPKNKEIFERVASKCYYPANQVILKNIDNYKHGAKRFKTSFSISGILLEQCERYEKDLLETFVQLKETGCVEFLAQTYHHSLFSLYEDPALFLEDVERHMGAVRELIGYEPVVFENTEFIYNNRIARLAEELGFKGIFTEGLERIAGHKGQNHVYLARGADIKVLLRNYKLTDDVGFRFSSRDWEEHPLTADKYSSWIASTPGDCINLFMDYETFGEHHWKETGIFNFLDALPGELLRMENVSFATPSEVIQKFEPAGYVDVFELGGTVSWADLERDTSCWLGNTMQQAAYSYHKRIGPRIREEDIRRIWGYLATSDHLYYMFTGGGGPGEVHSYFSPFKDPLNAFLNYLSVIFDIDARISGGDFKASEPFIFKNPEGLTSGEAYDKEGFITSLNMIRVDSLKYHLGRRDFSNWARHSLLDEALAEELDILGSQELSDKEIIAGLRMVFKKHAHLLAWNKQKKRKT